MVARWSKSPKCALVKHLPTLHHASAGCLSTLWLNLNLRPGLSVRPKHLKFVLYYKTSTSATSPQGVEAIFTHGTDASAGATKLSAAMEKVTEWLKLSCLAMNTEKTASTTPK